MGRNALNLHEDDVQRLCLLLHDWIQQTPLAATEEGYDWLRDLVSHELEPFNHGHRNYN